MILEKNLRPCIPGDAEKRRYYFAPYIEDLPPKIRHMLERYQRYLEQNLIYGRSIRKLGTLLFCLSYANQNPAGAGGIWQDIQRAFSGQDMRELYEVLDQVNTLRNERIVHPEAPMTDAEEAWASLALCFKCIKLVAEMV